MICNFELKLKINQPSRMEQSYTNFLHKPLIVYKYLGYFLIIYELSNKEGKVCKQPEAKKQGLDFSKISLYLCITSTNN